KDAAPDRQPTVNRHCGSTAHTGGDREAAYHVVRPGRQHASRDGAVFGRRKRALADRHCSRRHKAEMTGAHCGGPIRFDDGEAYERFMGRWSRAVGSRFLDWLAPAGDSHWLEAGCGTGAFTPLVSERCRPAAIVAFDPTPQQIAYARHHLLNKCVAF